MYRSETHTARPPKHKSHSLQVLSRSGGHGGNAAAELASELQRQSSMQPEVRSSLTALSQPSHSPLTALFCVVVCLAPPCCTIPCINAVFSYLRVMTCDIYLLSRTIIGTCQSSCFSPLRVIAHNDNCQCTFTLGHSLLIAS